MTSEHPHDIHVFLETVTREMAQEYERIYRKTTQDPGTAGDQGEENWAEVLSDWLPPGYSVVTKGRFINHSGEMSPQMDIVVLKDSYPQKLASKKIYLTAGVIAAFECKTTLKAEHISKAFETAQSVKNLFPTREGSPYKELHAPILYGVLAHSHNWKSKKSIPITNIENNIEKALPSITHPRGLLDLICVSDLCTMSVMKMTFIGPSNIPSWSDELAGIYGKDGSATTSFTTHHAKTPQQSDRFTPIGCLLTHLYSKIGWEDEKLREISDYFRLANFGGSGGGPMTVWPLEIYSKQIRNKVAAGLLSNGKFWDEWSSAFP